MTRTLSFPAVLFVLASCTGAIGAGDETAGEPAAPRAGGAPSVPPSLSGAASRPSAASCRTPGLRGASRDSLRRLTKDELVATLGQLVGRTLLSGVEASALVARYPDERPVSDVGQFEQLHSDAHVAAWAHLTDRIAELVAQSPDLRRGLGGACLAVDPVAVDCLRAFVAAFGRKAYRRPLPAAEIDRLVASAGGPATRPALQALLFSILMAPDVVFHIETGSAVEGGRVRLTDHEVASRVAYFVTGAPPDDELARAADTAGLRTLSQVEAQVRRLLATPAAKPKLRDLFDEWLHLSNVPSPDASAAAWARIPRDGLDEEMRQEAFEFVDHVLWRASGGYAELMQHRIAFPRTPRLAALYGAPVWTPGAAPSPAPRHAGLALRVGVLASAKRETSPILRGVFVRKELLCETMPSPEQNIVASRLEDLAALDPMQLPNHEIVTRITAPPGCAVCHKLINPVGFVLEGYDPLGRRREVESVLGDGGRVRREHPLIGTVTGLDLEPGLPTTYRDALELADALAASQKGRACVATRIFRHLQRKMEEDSDQCALAEATHPLRGNRPLIESVILSVANEDVFWRGE